MSTSSSAKSCPKCGATLPSAATDGLCPACLMAEAMVPTQTGADAAGALPLHTPEELAPHFPQLEILECLGRGGMGVVYKARQKALNRFVALKLLAPERVHDAGFAERFQKEAQALAALNHPHIVTVYDFGQTGRGDTPVAPTSTTGDKSVAAPALFYFIMEFVDGVNLRQAMKAGRFTPEQALAIVPPVCEALQYAHEHGIVHRDIKPENLLLDKEGRVKIADFGIAKMVGAAPGLAARPGAATDAPQAEGPASLSVGTPHYMAPEQKQHRRTDHRADIYSLGVVLYELLTGELPADKLQPPSHKVQIDVRLDEVVLRALEREPERRYQQASVLKTQVETILTTPPPGGATIPAEPSGVEARALSQRPPAAQAAGGVLPAAASPLYHRPGCFRERWSWDATFVWCVTALLAPLPGLLAACLISTLGAKALFFLLLELIPLLNALVCFAVLRRMDRLRDNLPPDALELAEALYAAHTAQSPCLAILCADHLELRCVAGEPVTIPLSDIEAVTEVRWLSGRRLWWKRGLKIQRRSAPPVVLALAAPVFQRWQPFLAGAVQKLAAQPSRAAVTPSPVESPTRILTRNLILVFGMVFGVVAIPIALASPYPWKQFGLICAPIMIIVGFLRLIGKWPFPSLLFPTGTPPSGATSDPSATGPIASPTTPPRFSRTAIVGACWAPLFFIAFVLMFCNATKTTGEYHGPAWWQILMMIVLGGLGITAPFGTTILGWIAVAQSRRSAGKLYGLGLAVFDGLLFPLLLLDGLCVGVLVGLSRIFVEFYANFSNVNNPQVYPSFVIQLANLLSQHPEITWFVALLLLLVVDFLIIRAVWRAVNKGSAPQVPSVGKTGTADSPLDAARGRQALEKAAPPGFLRAAINRRLKLVLPVALFLLVLNGFFLEAIKTTTDAAAPEIPRGSRCLVWKPARDFAPGDLIAYRLAGNVNLGRVASAETGNLLVRRNHESDTAVPRDAVVGKVITILWRGSSNAAQKISFGPVIERVVTNMIDFDSGALIDFPMAMQPDERDDARYDWIGGQDGKVPNKESYPWMRAHSVDAVEGNHDLFNLNLMPVARLEDRDWDSLTPAVVAKLLALNQPGAATDEFSGIGTYGFKTREGSLGIVQITDRHLPRGVKLRYKLVQGGATKAAAKPKVRAPQAVTATGSLIDGATSAATAGTTTKWMCWAAVAEADITAVSVGQVVLMTLDAFPQRTFQGKVAYIGNMPVTPATTQNYVTYETLIDLADPDPKFKVGMSVNVLFSVPQREGQTQAAAVAKPAPVSQATVEAARTNLALITARFNAGVADRLAVVEAEQNLHWAEALFSGDCKAAAIVRRDGANEKLALLAAKYKAGVIGPQEMAAVEKELAEAEAALAMWEPTPPAPAATNAPATKLIQPGTPRP